MRTNKEFNKEIREITREVRQIAQGIREYSHTPSAIDDEIRQLRAVASRLEDLNRGR